MNQSSAGGLRVEEKRISLEAGPGLPCLSFFLLERLLEFHEDRCDGPRINGTLCKPCKSPDVEDMSNLETDKQAETQG